MKGQLSIPNARIGFLNFEGRESTYNRAGDRNFVVFLDDKELVDSLVNDGWNIKFPKDDAVETAVPYLPVAISTNAFATKVVVISGEHMNVLKTGEYDFLDWAEIENVDLIIRPYHWENPKGESGIKAYAKSIYITLIVDDFQAKYGI